MRFKDYSVLNMYYTEWDNLNRSLYFYLLNMTDPYSHGSGDIDYKTENSKYDVNGIFRTI